ncbi:Coq4 family protein [Limnobacter sp.]|uniref:Coq4 family protein n=1 Tax=Limnobacter sp. TaxID=2003368 RepID=UPI0025BABE96|nr:Coq4 family protein [Limnobacter sp.]
MIRAYRIFNEWRQIQYASAEDKPLHVFRLVKLLGFKRYKNTRNRLLADPKFVELLERDTTLSDLLARWEEFEHAPEGSLAKAYYRFMTADEVDHAKFIIAYDQNKIGTNLSLHEVYDQRERDVHDLIHIVFGYTRSRWGEGATLVTQYWLGGAAAFGAIMLLGALRTFRRRPQWTFGFLRGTRDVYKRQKNIPFREYPFEDNLLTPLSQIREELGIGPHTKAMALCERFSTWDWSKK